MGPRAASDMLRTALIRSPCYKRKHCPGGVKARNATKEEEARIDRSPFGRRSRIGGGAIAELAFFEMNQLRSRSRGFRDSVVCGPRSVVRCLARGKDNNER
uniref:Uncharacterized protein n=1 Tax=Steinernema glaseri TaxID=37863 RepID=A0A1I7Y6E8_9BILA